MHEKLNGQKESSKVFKLLMINFYKMNFKENKTYNG